MLRLSIFNSKHKALRFVMGFSATLTAMAIFGYSYRFNDLHNSKWDWILYRHRSESRTKVKGVFIGSSYTWRGVRTEIIDPRRQNLNSARSHHGRDTDFWLVRESLERFPNLKNIYLEFKDFENDDLHPYWTTIRRVSDVAVDLSTDVRTGRWSKIREQLESSLHSFSQWSFAWTNFLFAHKASYTTDYHCEDQKCQSYEKLDGFYPDPIDKKMEDMLIPPPEAFQSLASFEYKSGTRYDRYLQKISKLCQDRGVKLSFYFVPVLEGILPSISMVHSLKKYGEVYIPSLENLRGPSFFDSTHLNEEGARLYSKELAQVLAQGPQSSPYYSRYH